MSVIGHDAEPAHFIAYDGGAVSFGAAPTRDAVNSEEFREAKLRDRNFWTV